ncbi:MAG TPA: hypothetical protein PKM12_06615, partial [Marmoricola sp.]|nr:hypothetical protein [Marmoricola sp.]
MGDLDRDAIDTAFAVTGGNPFLVEALARLLQVEDQVTADLVREAVPESVINSVVAWIAELGEAEQGLLQAVATLGHTTTSLAAGLVGIDLVTAGAAADRLRSIGILKDEAGLGFRHDLLRSATLTTFGVDAREHLHRAAATMLADADIEAAAAQLLQTTGSGDQTAVRILVAAAERALDAGAPRSAVTLLRRAVSEPPTVAETPSLVLQLGLAEMRTFDPTCVETLTRANRELTNPADRTRCALALAEALNFAGFHDRAAEVLEGALCAVDDPELSLELEARLISTHLLLPQRIEHARELLAARPGLRGRTPAERLFLNQQLCNAAGTNQPAADIRELVRLAIHADDTPERTDWVWARLFLVNVGEHDEVRRLADYGMDQALRVGSVSGMVTVSYLRGVNEIGAGCFQQAEFNFREMLDLGERISPGPLVPLLGRCGLAKTLALQGQVEQALQLLAEFPEEPPQNWPFNGVASLYAARAIAFHAASRPAEALENAQRLGRLLKRLDVDSPTWACWRAL